MIDKKRDDNLYSITTTDPKNSISTVNDDSLKTKNSEEEIAPNKVVINQPSLPNFEDNSFLMTNATNALPQPMQLQQQQPQISISNNSGDSQYVDPLEHSLASLESSHENKTDLNTIILAEIQKHQQQLQLGGNNQISVSNLPQTHNTVMNQLIPEFNGINGNSMNGIMSVLGMPLHTDVPNTTPFISHQTKTSRMSDTVWSGSLPVTSIQNIPLLNLETTSQISASFSQKSEKMLLTPKPIEELLAPSISSDKTKILSTPDVRVNYAFGQTFKYEQNIKNASSWSQLASVDPSHNTANKSRLPSDTFQEFRTKAKEQQQRQKQEQEKMKMQKEQEFKRQQESLVKQGKVEETVLTQR